MFCISLAARRFDALTTRLLEADDLNFLEALILAALFFESPSPVEPSQFAEAFGTTRGNVNHCISSLEAKGLVQRKIDPQDARAYHLALKPIEKKMTVKRAAQSKVVQMMVPNVGTGKSARTSTQT